MPIKRVVRHRRWTTIENSTLEDKSISWKARGLLGYLLSKPNDWEVILSHLHTQSDHDGRVSVRSGLDELIKAGYITREQRRSGEGKYKEASYIVSELPEP